MRTNVMSSENENIENITPIQHTPKKNTKPHAKNANVREIVERISAHKAKVGVIGLGYVGVPLMRTAAAKGFVVTGFDIDKEKVDKINRGESYLRHIPSDVLAKLVKDHAIHATTDFSEINEMDVVIICVPTPLSEFHEPVLDYIKGAGEEIAPHLRKGQTIILESSTFPGTTTEILKPILEQGGLKSGKDFFMAFSPEREDPGNEDFELSEIPKIIGGDGEDAQIVVNAFYSELVCKTVPVSSPEVAEAAKLTENIFRDINIALVNELKMIFDNMGIDIWEVVDAAKTKPFGFMPFYPGPGLGGHCIPVDPLYLTWKANQYGIPTQFIKLADDINISMPHYVIDRLSVALNERFSKELNKSKILVLGVAYKKNVEDMRESASLRIMKTLKERGVKLDYYDPFISQIDDVHGDEAILKGMKSIKWDKKKLATYDAAMILTDHDDVDYEELLKHCPLIIDTRNVTKDLEGHLDKVVKA